MSELINYIVKDLHDDSFKDDDVKRYGSMSLDTIDSLIKENKINSFTWNRLSVYHSLEDYEFWDKYEKDIEWESVCSFRLLSAEFIKRYRSRLGFKNILECQDLSLFLTDEEKKLVNSSYYWKNLKLRNLFNERYETGRDWFFGYIVKDSRDINFVFSRFYRIYSSPSYFSCSDCWFKIRVWYKDLVSPCSAKEFEVIRALDDNLYKR